MNHSGSCCHRLSRFASPEHSYDEDPAALFRPQQKHQREEAEKDLEEEERYPFSSNPNDFIGAPTASQKPSPLKGLKRRKAEWTKEAEETDEEEEAAEGERTRWEGNRKRAPKRSKKMR